MTIHCLYNAETNALLGISAEPHIVQPGQEQITLGRDMPDLTVEEWNPVILNFFTKLGTSITKLRFMKRITAQEFAAIKATAATNGEIDFFWQKFLAAQDIVVSDPELIAGLTALEQFGIIAPGRAAEIVA